jgi:transcriptional regulator with PAS, ATPase and Fis domain
MKKDMNDLKKLVHDIMNGNQGEVQPPDVHYASSFLTHKDTIITNTPAPVEFKADSHVRDSKQYVTSMDDITYQEAEEYHEDDTSKPLTLEDMEKQMIKKTLEKHRGKRKAAADELQISERTLYRKIKEYGIE